MLKRHRNKHIVHNTKENSSSKRSKSENKNTVHSSDGPILGLSMIRLRQTVLLMEGATALYDTCNCDPKLREDLSIINVLIQNSISYLMRLDSYMSEESAEFQMHIAAACLCLASRFYGSDDGVALLEIDCIISSFEKINYVITIEELGRAQWWAIEHMEFRVWTDFEQKRIPYQDSVPLQELHTGYKNLEKELQSLCATFLCISLFRIEIFSKVSDEDSVLSATLLHGVRKKEYVTSKFRESLWYVSRLMAGRDHAFDVDPSLFKLTLWDSSTRKSVCERMRAVILDYIGKLGKPPTCTYSGFKKDTDKTVGSTHTARQLIDNIGIIPVTTKTNETLNKILEFVPLQCENKRHLMMLTDDFLRGMTKRQTESEQQLNINSQ